MNDRVSTLEILLYGRQIGTLTRIPGDRTLFAFTDDYIADELRPTLSLGFKDRFGGLITEHRPVQTRLMPFFSNLLPEGYLRSYLARRASINPEREFFLLWVLGHDLPGALTVRPADAEDWPPDANDDRPALAPEERETALRFSLAGVQLKLSAVEHPKHGFTIPANGVGGSWIVKLPGHEFRGLAENEYSMMTLARLIGIDVPEVRLVETAAIQNLPAGVELLKGPSLAIKRFDRVKGGGSVHIEDFAQVFGVYPHEKYRRASYMNIASVVATECGAEHAMELVRRLTFNVLIGNADMHLKNWSMIYPDRRSARLAPAYDLVSTVAFLEDNEAALNFSRTKRLDEFDADELSHLAARARLPQQLALTTARETVALFRQHWATEKHHLPLSDWMIAKLEAHLEKVPLAKA